MQHTIYRSRAGRFVPVIAASLNLKSLAGCDIRPNLNFKLMPVAFSGEDVSQLVVPVEKA
jgi:hypothetical protein